ncbi:LysR family transcriptional regulator, partial [bacterium]|nr:LysR family transcriptional regulator [bacterium]
LRLLEIFGMLMLHQTTVAAAEALGISQPSVSTAIKHLEQQVGFALFAREKKRMVPTNQRRLLFEEVEPLFDQLR